MSIVSEEKYQENHQNIITGVDTEAPQIDSMRKALINTEKGLKDAVALLRNDMIDIVCRISTIEKRLNQLPSQCSNCHCNHHQKVSFYKV